MRQTTERFEWAKERGCPKCGSHILTDLGQLGETRRALCECGWVAIYFVEVFHA